MAEPEVLDVEQVAELLGVSPWTIRDLARQGRIPGRRVGKEWRFWQQALLEWLRGDRHGTEASNREHET